MNLENMQKIEPSTLSFLSELKKNNDREWFNANKTWYQEEQAKIVDFVDELLMRMKEHDQLSNPSAKRSLMRIYRDTRFSKDKTPYKDGFAGSFSRVKPELRGGYFFKITPKETVVGGGFYGPNPDDLKLLRAQITQDADPLRAVLDSKGFKQLFGTLMGDQVKTAPKGYPKDHPEIDLLRYKSMYAFRSFTDQEVLADDFMVEGVKTFLGLRPFFDVMTEYLTTDLNGLSLIE